MYNIHNLISVIQLGRVIGDLPSVLRSTGTVENTLISIGSDFCVEVHFGSAVPIFLTLIVPRAWEIGYTQPCIKCQGKTTHFVDF